MPNSRILLDELYRLTIRNIVKQMSVDNKIPNSNIIQEKPHNKAFTFIDLFAGIGGFHKGLAANGGECVFASEWDPYAQETYRANYPNTPLYGDITKEETKAAIPDKFDVLCAGFPCQAFSNAGLKMGFEDTRGTLFYEIADILLKHTPKVAFLENVRGLISHDKGKTITVILYTITHTGYRCNISQNLIDEAYQDIISGKDYRNVKKVQEECKKMVLRSREFGVPQNRQRIYIVLWRNDIGVDYFNYPTPTFAPTRLGDILEQTPDPKYTITDRMWIGHQNRKARNEAAGKGFGYSLFTPDSPYANTISARYWKDGSEILIAQPGKNPRTLTPREATRLQGYDDSFILNKSEKQAYKQAGNSVSIPVIKAIAKEIVSQLL